MVTYQQTGLTHLVRRVYLLAKLLGVLRFLGSCCSPIYMLLKTLLQYALGDFAVSQAAAALNKPADEIALYANRSMGFVNIWDSSVTSDGFSGFSQRRLAVRTFSEELANRRDGADLNFIHLERHICLQSTRCLLTSRPYAPFLCQRNR